MPPSVTPKRSPHATLHLYSRVMSPDHNGAPTERPLPVCPHNKWTPPSRSRAGPSGNDVGEQGDGKEPDADVNGAGVDVVGRQGVKARIKHVLPRDEGDGGGGDFAAQSLFSMWSVTTAAGAVVVVLLVIVVALRLTTRRRHSTASLSSTSPASSPTPLSALKRRTASGSQSDQLP